MQRKEKKDMQWKINTNKICRMETKKKTKNRKKNSLLVVIEFIC